MCGFDKGILRKNILVIHEFLTFFMIMNIFEKKDKLKFVAKELKDYFIGIDEIIDKVIMNISAWYCMPEILTRPTIVCLWGLTGTGKTDLVRRLVKLLNFLDNFVEIQLTSKGSSQHIYSYTLQDLLEDSNISTEHPGILLLDEIQRFRTVSEDGTEVRDYTFQDLWMLLSDGNFGSETDNKYKISSILLNSLYENDRKKEEKTEEKNVFQLSFWQANQLKKRLKLSESLEEIMKWDHHKKMEIIHKKTNSKEIHSQRSYSKLLIFISGNLDEAYKMSSNVEDADLDADIFHANSKSINVVSIKTALKKRFKPEQIARLGNTHIIYPSFSKLDYRKLIEKKINEITDKIYQNVGIKVFPAESIYELIYRNGVFPAQGTRPLFSTIASLFESPLPNFVMQCFERNISSFILQYEANCLYSDINGQRYEIQIDADIDLIKQRKKSSLIKTSVHEAGHAVLYGILFGYAPTQIIARASADETNGFIAGHNKELNKTIVLKHVAILLGGRVAEELIFGKDNVGTGAYSDIDTATTYCAYYVRSYAMGELPLP